jgi:hypothetical protein
MEHKIIFPADKNVEDAKKEAIAAFMKRFGNEVEDDFKIEIVVNQGEEVGSGFQIIVRDAEAAARRAASIAARENQ